jgi:hypothetical protein
MQEEESSLSDNEYYVEKVLDKKIENGEVLYLIKWDGWPIENSTWEPLENLDNIKNLIEKYENEKADTKKRLGRPPKTLKDRSVSSGIKNSQKKEEGKVYKKQLEEPCQDEKSLTVNVITDLGDLIPEQVLSVKRDQEQNILCYVNFKERSDGTTQDNSYIPSYILKEKYPKILISYYESKIKFVDKK